MIPSGANNPPAEESPSCSRFYLTDRKLIFQP
jgi:hypothetical protein